MKNYYLALLFLSLKIHSSCFGDCVYGLKLKFDIGLQKELFQTMENGNIERAESIIRRNRNHAHSPNTFGQTPLYSAVSSQNLPMVRFLLTNSARPNVLTNTGDTALHLATKNRMTEVLVYLLSSCSSFMYTQDSKGFIALDYARENKYHFLMKMLMINKWQEINPTLFIDKNQEFFDISDETLVQNYIFTGSINELEDYVKQCLEDNFPHQLANYIYIIFELKNLFKEKKDNNILYVSKNCIKDCVESFFCSDLAHSRFPNRFVYKDLISNIGVYDRPYPVIDSMAKKFTNHPITRTPISSVLDLTSSFKYWQAKNKGLTVSDFNEILAEGDQVSFEQFEMTLDQARSLAELEGFVLPEDLSVNFPNGFLPGNTFTELVSVKKQ